MSTDTWVVITRSSQNKAPPVPSKQHPGDDGWTTVKCSFGKVDDGLIHPPPRETKLHVVYEALLEGRIEWGPEW